MGKRDRPEIKAEVIILFPAAKFSSPQGDQALEHPEFVPLDHPEEFADALWSRLRREAQEAYIASSTLTPLFMDQDLIDLSYASFSWAIGAGFDARRTAWDRAPDRIARHPTDGTAWAPIGIGSQPERVPGRIRALAPI